MGIKKGVSIIIPVLNEVGNITSLISRIRSTMATLGLPYEIIFIDDNSTDGTQKKIQSFISRSNDIKLFAKIGLRGKSYSIIEGVDHSSYSIVCMIDADLQYAPENISPMVNLLIKSQSDIVITNRKTHATSALRKLSSSVFHALFTRILFGIDYDTQSGLKVFKRSVFKSMHLSPSPWSFDLEFIVQSLLRNYTIASFDIAFEARMSGEAKISVSAAAIELARESIRLRKEIPGNRLRRMYKLNDQRLIRLGDII